jgi:hypothetical protein
MRDANELLQNLEAVEERQGGVRPPKIRYTHDSMIDLIIANPAISQNDIAAHFGYTPSWVSIIFTSDAFQAKLAARRAELVDPAIAATIEETFKALTHQSLKILMKKLEAPVVSDNLALRAAELGAKSLGLGGHAAPPVQDPSRLESLAERLTGLLNRKRVEYQSGEIIEIPYTSVQRPQPVRDESDERTGEVQTLRGDAD